MKIGEVLKIILDKTHSSFVAAAVECLSSSNSSFMLPTNVVPCKVRQCKNRCDTTLGLHNVYCLYN